EEELTALHDRLIRPLWPRGGGGFDDLVHFRRRAERNLGDHFAGRGVVHVAEARTRAVEPFSSGQELHVGDVGGGGTRGGGGGGHVGYPLQKRPENQPDRRLYGPRRDRDRFLGRA